MKKLVVRREKGVVRHYWRKTDKIALNTITVDYKSKDVYFYGELKVDIEWSALIDEIRRIESAFERGVKIDQILKKDK